MNTLSKKRSLLCIPLVLVLATSACAGEVSDETAEAPKTVETGEAGEAGETPEPSKEKVSYAIGWQAGSSFEQQGLELDQTIFMDGLREAMAGGESKWTEAEMAATLQALQSRMVAKQQKAAEEQGTVNQTEGGEFLAANGQREGVTTTASGLQYEVITGGDGPSPAGTDTVTVHYRGTLIDGTEFDSSYSRNAPATFALNQVIPGWTEGVQLMSIGSKYKLYVPSELGYGMRGAGPKIGPGAALIFEVELLDIAQ